MDGNQFEMDIIVLWYRDLPSDFLGINELMNKRQKLAGYLVWYASETGKQRKIWAIQKAIYEKTKSQLRVKYQEQGTTKADNISRANSVAEFEKECEEEGEYYEMYFKMKAYQEVLSAMSQQIAELREEIKARRYGQ